MFGFFKKRPPQSIPLETQLSNLATCGIRLAEGVTTDDLLESYSRDCLEEPPYEMLLYAMGSELEQGPSGPVSVDVYHLDTECIEDEGAYVYLFERLVGLTNRELKVESVVDSLTHERAELRFEMDGEQFRWEFRVENDWIDPALIEKFDALLQQKRSGRRLATLVTDGQDTLLVCQSPSNIKRLNALTGMVFVVD